MRRGYAIIEIRKNWVANRTEYKDLIVNKENMKNIKNEIRSFGLSFLRDQKHEEQKKEEERKEEKKKRKKKEEKSKRYEYLWVFMDYVGYLYRFLWIYMEKKSNHKPIF